MVRQFHDMGLAFGQCRTADGPEYWDDPEGRRATHRRHVRNLLIACVLVIPIGIVIHPSLLMVLVLLGPFLLLELYQLRRSGNQSPPEILPPRAPHEP